MMAKDALWGELEENNKDDKKIANVAEKKDASERIIVARRNSDEEMESDDEEDVDDKIKAMDKTTEVEEEGNVRASIIRTAVRSEGFFRHQQVGEGDLSEDEKKKIVTELVQNKPAVFLQRFGRFLSVSQLDYFESLQDDDFELSHYLRETKQLTCRKVRQQRVKNRRYAMLQRMLASSDTHFSESAMRERNPLLYQQLVGKFMTAEEKAADEAVDMTNCSLSKIILEHMDINKERDDRKREEKEEQEEEFDSEEEADGDDKNVARLEGGKEFLKQEFVNAAYQSFLAGKDPGLDYAQIDADATLDDLEAEELEQQERYFDESDENDE